MENEEKPPQETLLREIAATLRTIRGWVTFLGIVVLLGLIGTCLMTAGAFSGTASIVASFHTPCTNGVYGIDYHGGYLYHADGGMRVAIYKTTTTGSIVESLPNITSAYGIDRTDLEFWTSTYAGFVFRLSTAGSIIRCFKGPGSTAGYGVSYGEGFLWYSNGLDVYKLTGNGSMVNSFKPPCAATGDVCWETPYLWIAGWNYKPYHIWQVTQTGSVVESVPTTGQPYGVTWDGAYLWYSAANWVYKVKVNFTGVGPASLGRVKALFR